MKFTTNLITILLVLLFVLPLNGKKRPDPIGMEQLTNPNSLNYVPIPYPKNRKEVITDLEYYIKRFCNKDRKSRRIVVGGSASPGDAVLRNLLEPKPIYKIGKIFKIRNRIYTYPDDHTWLIFIIDKKQNAVMRLSFDETGIFGESSTITDGTIAEANSEIARKAMNRFRKSLTGNDIKKILSQSLGKSKEWKDIKKIERVAYPSPMGDPLYPMFEITMKDGSFYFYSESRDMIYRIDKKIKWRQSAERLTDNREEIHELGQEYLLDSIDDQFLMLKSIPRKSF